MMNQTRTITSNTDNSTCRAMRYRLMMILGSNYLDCTIMLSNGIQQPVSFAIPIKNVIVDIGYHNNRWNLLPKYHLPSICDFLDQGRASSFAGRVKEQWNNR